VTTTLLNDIWLGLTKRASGRYWAVTCITGSANGKPGGGNAANESGFTLLEVMIVVALIAVIAVIAMPMFTRVRINSNEASAIGALRVISSAEINFFHIEGRFGDLTELGAAVPPFLQPDLAGGEKHGYLFAVAAITDLSFECTANPKIPGTSGISGFFVDESGVIRRNPSGPATVDSAPIQ